MLEQQTSHPGSGRLDWSPAAASLPSVSLPSASVPPPRCHSGAPKGPETEFYDLDLLHSPLLKAYLRRPLPGRCPGDVMVNPTKYQVTVLASCLLLDVFHRAIQGGSWIWDTV